MGGWGRVRIGLAAGVTLALLAAESSAATRVPLVPVGGPDGQELAIRPGFISYSLSGFFAGPPQAHNGTGHLRWTSWTSGRALGSGYDWIQKRCQPIPICIGLGYNLYPVDLRLSQPRTERGHLVFMRMTIDYEGGRPPGSPRTRTFEVLYISDGFNWSLTF